MPANAIEGIGLTYRTIPSVKLTETWEQAVHSTPTGPKPHPKLLIGTFLGYPKVDSCGYRCLNCQCTASRDPVTGSVFCEGACTTEPITDTSIEITATADIRFEGGRELPSTIFCFFGSDFFSVRITMAKPRYFCQVPLLSEATPPLPRSSFALCFKPV